MRLWYASDNSSLGEYLWVENSDSESESLWRWQDTWTDWDVFAGLGCHNGGPVYAGGPDLPVFVSLVNLHSELEVWTMSAADARMQLDQRASSSPWTNGKSNPQLACLGESDNAH